MTLRSVNGPWKADDELNLGAVGRPWAKVELLPVALHRIHPTWSTPKIHRKTNPWPKVDGNNFVGGMNDCGLRLPTKTTTPSFFFLRTGKPTLEPTSWACLILKGSLLTLSSQTSSATSTT